MKCHKKMTSLSVWTYPKKKQESVEMSTSLQSLTSYLFSKSPFVLKGRLLWVRGRILRVMESAVRVWQGRGALSLSDKALNVCLSKGCGFNFPPLQSYRGRSTAVTTGTATDSNLNSNELRDSHHHCVFVCVWKWKGLYIFKKNNK